MITFNRKQAIGAIDTNILIKDFESQLTPVNTGWAIFWKGEMVKPERGTNHYYASYNAALQAIDRNSNFTEIVIKHLAEKLYGIIIDTRWSSECAAYRNYFRCDLTWEDVYRGGKIITRKHINMESLSPEDQKLREECESALYSFESFCRNALKTVFIKQWIKDGILNIKKV